MPGVRLPIRLGIFFGALLVCSASSAEEPPLAERLEELEALIRPQPKEQRWLEVPWTTDLWDARRRAAEQGRPIFLWEMDGHPLGCT